MNLPNDLDALGLNGWPLWLIGDAGVHSSILRAFREVQTYGIPDDFFAVLELKKRLDSTPNPPDPIKEAFRKHARTILGNYNYDLDIAPIHKQYTILALEILSQGE